MFLPGGNYKFYSGLDQSIMNGLRDVWTFNPHSLWKMPRYTDFLPKPGTGKDPWWLGPSPWQPPRDGGWSPPDPGHGDPPWWPGGGFDDDDVGGPPPWWKDPNDNGENDGDIGEPPPWWHDPGYDEDDDDSNIGGPPPWWHDPDDNGEDPSNPYQGNLLVEIFKNSANILKKYDRNGDGKVTLKEIEKENKDFAKIAQLADLDKDGLLSVTENMAIYKYADSQGNLDGIITEDEIKKAKAKMADDPKTARKDLQTHYEDIQEGLDELKHNKKPPQDKSQYGDQISEWIKDFVDMVLGFLGNSFNKDPRNTDGGW